MPHLRVFGSIAHVHVLDKRKAKLDDKREIHLHRLKEYKLYNPINKKMIVNRDVVFDEEGQGDF